MYTGTRTPKILLGLRARIVNPNPPNWSQSSPRYRTNIPSTKPSAYSLYESWLVLSYCLPVFQVRTEQAPSSSRQRPVSDGVMYGNFNERRIEYEEVLLSEQTTESQYSQSESYLSERYNTMQLPSNMDVKSIQNFLKKHVVRDFRAYLSPPLSPQQ